MKQYKLIKEYPGSPKLGTKIFNDGVFKGHYYTHVNGIKTYLGTIEPYKYPEFWKEVIEKDYEILSFKTTTGLISSLQSNGKYFCVNNSNSVEFNPNSYYCGYTTEEELRDGSIIYSVKRLSDGEIFTVDDKIKSYPADEGFKIKHIWINDDDEILLADYPKGSTGKRSCYLSSKHLINLTKIEHIVQEAINKSYLSEHSINITVNIV